MHFCTECNNMYYTRLGGENQNKLIYYCNKCGHEDDALSSDPNNICVSKTHIKTTESTFRHMVNEYTNLDPTLPRAKNIPCPNTACSSREKDIDNEVIYLRYDDANLKYVYICNNCQTVWKSENN